MSGNRGTVPAMVFLAAIGLIAGCGTAGTGAPEETSAPTARTSGSVAATTTPDTTSPAPVTAETSDPVRTGEATGDATAATGDAGGAGVVRDSANLEAKRWGGADYDPGLAAKMPADPLYPGDRTEVLGQAAVICAAGGFYGVHYVAAPDPGSCGSAEAALAAAFGDEDAMDNVHFAEPRTVDVGDGRAVRCVEKGNILFDCRGPEGAPVAWFW
ncbi:hypothetical protein JIM95_001070 [Corynebacterium sp. CCM 8835]|uniref:Secreted protein n=1 Tax=Corynebacterium antarcticum TaxID=2800405 RepID=A0A9Q4CCH7_9CORY|nr:hypothetical protein [Corynebacterium antarcticum]MCK7641521.1 hypothetical protein [Corynebacterium antarcticum]MCK7660381.1 hypothetical protein [Corynebacterium antarcticum]MCL0244749.1 hypothetical protein [Corynebacterium antarcticum]MCX7491122.1 hypothetical protein [Corynebacterium antarcticum]MCX7537147.1 hypothetical protein [Corynebacterium antarcticum]